MEAMQAFHRIYDSAWAFQPSILFQIQPFNSVLLRVPLFFGNAWSLPGMDHGVEWTTATSTLQVSFWGLEFVHI
jgi:hypothetical protein